MPKDAKFGLILGVGLVILITVIFFRKDGESQAEAAVAARTAQTAAPATPAQTGYAATRRPETLSYRQAPAEPTGTPGQGFHRVRLNTHPER